MSPLDKLKASPAGLARIAAADTGLMWDYPPHLRALNAALLEVAAGHNRFLMVFMPPGHAKSSIISEAFPAWILGTQPNAQVILSTYGQEFSETWGRKARDLLVYYGPVLYGVGVRQDSKSVSEWRVAGRRGVMYSVGVGGQTTGKRADYALIDDPVKNQQEAESEVMRDNLYDWFQRTLYTRLTPAGAIVLCMCMTGDTLVMMHDGQQKPLRDVRPGDSVATYENGTIAITSVRKWANQGPDVVYTIRMKSGTVVRANARHPFLTLRDGVEVWARTDTLKKGSLILRATGENGAGLPVQLKDARSLLSVRDSAPLTTAKNDGLMGIAQCLTNTQQDECSDSGSDTASVIVNTTDSLPNRAASVRYAESRHQPTTRGRIGADISASIMTTIPDVFADSSAMTATSPLAMVAQPNVCAPPLHTLSVTPDEVIDVGISGFEDVYDLQIDRTENFIANGLVSHNTRWHHDDLAGRLLRDRDEGRGLPWRVLNFPALAEEGDALGRAEGEALWPRLYGRERLAEIQAAISEQAWLAMYQQRPTPSEGAMYHREWFDHRYDELPQLQYRVMTVDSAFKTGVGADYTAIEIWGVTNNGFYLVHVLNERLEYPELIRALIDLAAEHRVAGIYIEDKASGQSAVQTLQRETRLPVVAVPVRASKEQRADGNTPTWRAGRIFLPRHAAWVGPFVEQHILFPRGAHDDMVDASNIALDVLKYGGVSYGKVSY